MVLFPHLLLEVGEFFSSIYYGNLVEVLQVNLTVLWAAHLWLVLLLFNSQCCLHSAFSNSSITVQYFLPGTGLINIFHLWVSAPVYCISLYLPVFAVLGTAVYPMSSLLVGPRRVFDFSVCSAFYVLLGQNGDFKTHYMWNQKLEFPHF